MCGPRRTEIGEQRPGQLTGGLGDLDHDAERAGTPPADIAGRLSRCRPGHRRLTIPCSEDLVTRNDQAGVFVVARDPS